LATYSYNFTGVEVLLGQNVISIDFGCKNIKVVEGRQQGNGVVLEKAVAIPAPPNSIKDGKILDIKKMADTISDVLQQERMNSKKAVIAIKSTAIITRDIIIPYVKKDQIEAIVKMEIARYLPIMLNEYVTEYRVREEFMEDNVKKIKLLVVALPKKIVEDYLELLKELHLKPVALDITSNALSKLFIPGVLINDEIFSLDQTVSIIDIGHASINVNIISKGVIQFSRLITTGSEDIDINLINSFNLSPEDAEKTKIEQSNLRMNADLTADEAVINDAVKSIVDNWIREIQRVFQYHLSRENNNKIDKIYLYGAGALINGLSEYIRISFNIPAEQIKTVSSVKTSRKTELIELSGYLDASGAIIRR